MERQKIILQKLPNMKIILTINQLTAMLSLQKGVAGGPPTLWQQCNVINHFAL